ncbi:MAG: nucleotidyltransferase domain-containing protein [Actinomycetota bacterium]
MSRLPFSRSQLIELRRLCERWKVQELAIFGSSLRGELTGESDLDLLVSYKPEAEWTLFDEEEFRFQLFRLLARPIDLVNRKAIERSENWILRKEILGTAETIYAA